MNFIHDVIELNVFDEKGKHITRLDSLKAGSLKYHPSGNKEQSSNSYLYVDDAFMNLSMLEQIGEKISNDEESDFDKSLNDKDETVIKFNLASKRTYLKLVGKGIAYDAKTNSVSHEFKIIIHRAQLIPSYELDTGVDKLYMPNYAFRLLPYNDNKDVFEVRVTKR